MEKFVSGQENIEDTFGYILEIMAMDIEDAVTEVIGDNHVFRK